MDSFHQNMSVQRQSQLEYYIYGSISYLHHDDFPKRTEVVF